MKMVGPERLALEFDSDRFDILTPLSAMAASRCPKLYIASANEKPLYVGVTIQNIRKRLYQGWNARGANGYHGYAWRHGLQAASLDVWFHENPLAQAGHIDIETVEAEVVFLIRRAGQWPQSQTEIHFHPSAARHRRAAAAIASRYGIRSELRS
jgi:hypothetical protein